MQCKFIKSNGKRCGNRIAIFDDGYCINHSQTEKAKEARSKRQRSKVEKEVIGKRLKVPNQSPLVQIRKNCIECCGDNVKAVMFCSSVDCKLWFLRFGKLPKAVVREKGEDWIRIFDEENFKEGGKYDPDILIDDMEL